MHIEKTDGKYRLYLDNGSTLELLSNRNAYLIEAIIKKDKEEKDASLRRFTFNDFRRVLHSDRAGR